MAVSLYTVNTKIKYPNNQTNKQNNQANKQTNKTKNNKHQANIQNEDKSITVQKHIHQLHKFFFIK